MSNYYRCTWIARLTHDLYDLIEETDSRPWRLYHVNDVGYNSDNLVTFDLVLWVANYHDFNEFLAYIENKLDLSDWRVIALQHGENYQDLYTSDGKWVAEFNKDEFGFMYFAQVGIENEVKIDRATASADCAYIAFDWIANLGDQSQLLTLFRELRHKGALFYRHTKRKRFTFIEFLPCIIINFAIRCTNSEMVTEVKTKFRNLQTRNWRSLDAEEFYKGTPLIGTFDFERVSENWIYSGFYNHMNRCNEIEPSDPLPKKWLVDVYLTYEERSDIRHEYIDGEVRTIPDATDTHSLISSNIKGSLWQKTRETSCRIYSSEMRVKVSETKFLYPDLSIVCGNAEFADENRTMITNPTLVIEVTSPLSESYDKGIKADYYQSLPSLQAYLIIDQHQIQAQLYVRQGDDWLLRRFHDLNRSIPLLNFDLPLSDIYFDIHFDDKVS